MRNGIDGSFYYRAGAGTIAHHTSSVVVTFSSPITSSYSVSVEAINSYLELTVTDKTTTGFTVSTWMHCDGVTFDYIAIANN